MGKCPLRSGDPRRRTCGHQWARRGNGEPRCRAPVCLQFAALDPGHAGHTGEAVEFRARHQRL